MHIPAEQVTRLYKPDEVGKDIAQKSKYQKYSNRDLLKNCAGNDPVKMAAFVLLRPKASIRYHLVPALVAAFAEYRPLANKSVPVQEEEKLPRHLAFLLDLYDPAWKELPKQWAILGSYLNKNIYYNAYETLMDCLKATSCENPMLFLQNFCRDVENDTEWLRYFWLSEKDFQELIAEKDQTIAMINQVDNVVELTDIKKS